VSVAVVLAGAACLAGCVTQTIRARPTQLVERADDLTATGTAEIIQLDGEPATIHADRVVDVYLESAPTEFIHRKDCLARVPLIHVGVLCSDDLVEKHAQDALEYRRLTVRELVAGCPDGKPCLASRARAEPIAIEHRRHVSPTGVAETIGGGIMMVGGGYCMATCDGELIATGALAAGLLLVVWPVATLFR
jgi:hypothetical protein